MKRIICLLTILIASSLFLIKPVFAQTSKTEIKIFVREGCAHCAAEEKFLNKIVKERSDIEINYYHLEDEAQRKIWADLTTQIEVAKVTPITVIGESFIVGFGEPDTTGKQILQLIEATQKQNLTTDLTKLSTQSMYVQSSTCGDDPSQPCTVPKPAYLVKLPLLGEINLQQYPLFVLASILGFIDGFNPCAMWVLITFLIILMQVGDRKKMITFVGTFIFAEAVMYYLILTVWFKTWNFIQLDKVVTPIVGLISIGAGIFFLREWHKKRTECIVTDVEERQQIRHRIKELASQNLNLVTFLGILGLAFSVNIIEFACSIGIPQAFTKILELNHPGFVVSQLMMAIYIFFYMIDDLVVFAIAVWSAGKIHQTAKYTQASHLIGGVLMLILGLIMLIKPSLLLF